MFRLIQIHIELFIAFGAAVALLRLLYLLAIRFSKHLKSSLTFSVNKKQTVKIQTAICIINNSSKQLKSIPTPSPRRENSDQNVLCDRCCNDDVAASSFGNETSQNIFLPHI